MATFMAVHAHPDDEATSTGGVLARYSDEGVRTIVVTCTNGELGDLPGGIKPDMDGHDEEAVVKLRLKELEHACEILGVSDVELLGYRDSGMADWEHKGHEDAFCNVPLEAATDRLAALFERYRPDVVATYDQEGPYNHPDHIQTSRVTLAAAQKTGIPKKVYLSAMRMNRFARIRDALEKAGVEMPPRPEPSADWLKKGEEQAKRITTVVDVSPFVGRKLSALRTHASQVQDTFWSKIPDDVLADVFGEECFIRVHDATGSAVPEDDLLAGLR